MLDGQYIGWVNIDSVNNSSVYWCDSKFDYLIHDCGFDIGIKCASLASIVVPVLHVIAAAPCIL